jgi:hypothetical protein
MIYAKVDAQHKAELDTEMNRTKDAKWYRRLKIIDLSGQGFSVPELSEMFDLGDGTIRRYIHAYNEAGLDGLRPGYGQGSKQQTTELGHPSCCCACVCLRRLSLTPSSGYPTA